MEEGANISVGLCELLWKRGTYPKPSEGLKDGEITQKSGGKCEQSQRTGVTSIKEDWNRISTTVSSSQMKGLVHIPDEMD